MIHSAYNLVAVTTKSLRVQWKCFDWHERKRLHTPRKTKHSNALWNWNTTLSRRENKKLSYAWADHVLNIHLCVKFVVPFIFTQIQREEMRLFNKNNGASLMYGRLIYVSMEH